MRFAPGRTRSRTAVACDGWASTSPASRVRGSTTCASAFSPSYLCPTQVEVQSDRPRHASGCIRRSALRAEAPSLQHLARGPAGHRSTMSLLLEADADALTGHRNTLFKGATLRGLLLSTFARSTVDSIPGLSSRVRLPPLPLRWRSSSPSASATTTRSSPASCSRYRATRNPPEGQTPRFPTVASGFAYAAA